MTELDIDAPHPSFAELGLSKELQKAVEEQGWSTPTLVQSQSFPLVAKGRDVIVQSRTGTGKTGAFALPILDHIVDESLVVQALI